MLATWRFVSINPCTYKFSNVRNTICKARTVGWPRLGNHLGVTTMVSNHTALRVFYRCLARWFRFEILFGVSHWKQWLPQHKQLRVFLCCFGRFESFVDSQPVCTLDATEKYTLEKLSVVYEMFESFFRYSISTKSWHSWYVMHGDTMSPLTMAFSLFWASMKFHLWKTIVVVFKSSTLVKTMFKNKSKMRNLYSHGSVYVSAFWQFWCQKIRILEFLDKIMFWKKINFYWCFFNLGIWKVTIIRMEEQVINGIVTSWY